MRARHRRLGDVGGDPLGDRHASLGHPQPGLSDVLLLLGHGELSGLREAFDDVGEDCGGVCVPDVVEMVGRLAEGLGCGEGVGGLEDLDQEL